MQLPVVILKKSSISDMQHRKTYSYFNFQQNWVSRSVKTVHTNVFAKMISYIDWQIPIVFSKKSRIDSVDLLEPRSIVISTDDGHVRNVSRYLKSSSIYNTRCTRGDARSSFCTYKTYLHAQNEISYEYIQILF